MYRIIIIIGTIVSVSGALYFRSINLILLTFVFGMFFQKEFGLIPNSKKLKDDIQIEKSTKVWYIITVILLILGILSISPWFLQEPDIPYLDFLK